MEIIAKNNRIIFMYILFTIILLLILKLNAHSKSQIINAKIKMANIKQPNINFNHAIDASQLPSVYILLQEL